MRTGGRDPAAPIADAASPAGIRGVRTALIQIDTVAHCFKIASRDRSSSGQSCGSIAIEAWQRIEKISIGTRLCCAPLQFAIVRKLLNPICPSRTLLKLFTIRRRAMARMAVITPSFAPDFELCVALNRSVLDNSPRHGPASHHRASVGPQAVRSARRSTYAYPLRG